MKEKILLLMMLCALSSLCHAQNVKYEYDEAGNLVKRHSGFVSSEDHSIDDRYSIKVSFYDEGNKMNIKFYDVQSGDIVNCPISIIINPVVDYPYRPIPYIYENGNITIDLHSLPSNIFYLSMSADVNSDGNTISKQLKFKKK